ncbi:MAG: FliM/FliN family flagellar motor switch protein, partial [Planctomycetota bacterium]|nr:FliM/FliN family flagellar motor switch protein [Planctomycetota bacterium]
GDIITTEKDMREGLNVFVEGVTKFRAKPGAFKGRKAIQIDQSVSTVTDKGKPTAAALSAVPAPVSAKPVPAAPVAAKKK